MNNLSAQQEKKSVIPFLVGRSTQRTDGPNLPGHYCANAHVWVIDGPNGPEPLVHSSEAVLDLATKTKVERERDDQQNHVLLAAITKTAVQLESDDDKVYTSSRARLAELATKTEANRERDD